MESYLDFSGETISFCKNSFTIPLMCEAAQKFDDLETVRFIKEYGENPYFFLTKQCHKCQFYVAFMLDNQFSCQVFGKSICFPMCIGLGMSPSHIKNLIENGADVNCAKDIDQIPPLLKACGCANYETVKILLDAGADPTHRTNTNDNALHLAYYKNSDEVFFLIYDELLQRNQSESDLLQYFTSLDPWFQNIIKEILGDRNMLRVTQRLYVFMVGQCHMNARELGYNLEKLAKYDHGHELTTRLLVMGNNRNDSQMIHVLLRLLFRQKKTQLILNGYRLALEKICKPSILNLYVSYSLRLGEANRYV